VVKSTPAKLTAFAAIPLVTEALNVIFIVPVVPAGGSVGLYQMALYRLFATVLVFVGCKYS
jgi:hypothetical protein